jgi:hypothetical protein
VQRRRAAALVCARRRVLVAEDNAGQPPGSTIRDARSSFGLHSVVARGHGVEAVARALRRRAPTLVFMDLPDAREWTASTPRARGIRRAASAAGAAHADPSP